MKTKQKLEKDCSDKQIEAKASHYKRQRIVDGCCCYDWKLLRIFDVRITLKSEHLLRFFQIVKELCKNNNI